VTNSFNYLRPVPPASPDFRAPAPLELVQPFSRRRMRLSRSAALQLIYEDGDSAAASSVREPAAPADAAQHWAERNWTWSLPYYLFSRDVLFADRDDDRSRSIRRSVLSGYAQHGQPPAPPEPAPPRVALPRPEQREGQERAGLGEVLRRRRSLLRPTRRSVPTEVIGELLWQALPRLRQSLLTTRRSGQDLTLLLNSLGCAFDMYLVAYDVPPLAAGIYQYLPVEHELAPARAPDDTDELRKRMREVLIGQPAPMSAAATVAIVADFERYQWRYRQERALRQLYIDAGRVMAYLVLSATACGRQTQITPAAHDDRAAEFFGYDRARQQLLYSLNLS
jgi:SagB-type dehydrogenase family enzyme